MSTGLAQARVTKPALGSSQTHFFVVVAADDLAVFFFVALASDTRSSVRKTAETPDGSLAVPPKPRRVRFVVVTRRFLPFFVTVRVFFVVRRITWLARGLVMSTVGGAPSVS